jgi:hypothetical protein
MVFFGVFHTKLVKNKSNQSERWQIKETRPLLWVVTADLHLEKTWSKDQKKVTDTIFFLTFQI